MLLLGLNFCGVTMILKPKQLTRLFSHSVNVVLVGDKVTASVLWPGYKLTLARVWWNQAYLSHLPTIVPTRPSFLPNSFITLFLLLFLFSRTVEKVDTFMREGGGITAHSMD